MKTVVLAIMFLMTCNPKSNCQTTATNFTATDCNSNSHTLFTQLDSGYVVVLAWVMPCPACINPTKTAYNLAKSYNSKPAYAGRVKFYLVDDLSDHNCSILSAWATNNNIGPDILYMFDNAPNGTAIDENDYGGTGMPHIAIISPDRKVLFNKFNSDANDAAGIEAALYTALTPASVGKAINMSGGNLTVYPNPATEKLFINYTAKSNGPVDLKILNVLGQQVMEATKAGVQGENSHVIDISSLAGGTYYLQINIDNANAVLKFDVLK